MKLIFLLFLLCIPTVIADQFYSNWAYPGDTFEQDGALYAIREGNSPYTIALQKNDITYVISYGECQISYDRLERYCYTESDYVDCERDEYICPESNTECCPYDVSHVQYDGGVQWGVFLTMEKITPELTLTRTVDNSQLKLGELARVKLSIENEGESAITSALLQEVIPSNFTYQIGDLNFKNGLATKTLNINPGQTLVLFYTLKAENFGKSKITGNISYQYKGDEQLVKPGDLTLNVPSPYEITTSLKKSTIDIRENTEYVYTIENNENEDLEFDVEITGLASIIEDYPNDATREDDLFIISGRIDRDSKETFRFDVHSDLTGKFDIIANTTMQIGGEQFTHLEKQTLTVDIELPEPEIKTTPEVFSASEPVTINLYLNNREGTTSFSNVNARLDGPGVNKLFTFPTIQVGDNPLIISLNLIAPVDNAEYTFSGTYQSLSQEVFEFSLKKTVEVDDSNIRTKHIITQTLNQTQVRINNSIKVNIKVKNYFPDYRTVSVRDIIPQGTQVNGGLVDKELSLTKDQERDAYTYTLFIPPDFTGTELPIKTEVVDQLSGEIFTAQMNVSVIHPEPEPVINETVEPAPEPGPQVEVQEEGKQGFFSKMWTGVKNFFGGIFS